MGDETKPKQPAELAQAREAALRWYGYGTDVDRRDAFVLGWMERAGRPPTIADFPLKFMKSRPRDA